MTKRIAFVSDDRGAVAALYAIALPVLVAMAGIGFDYARVASLDTELQNAADQAALAGATQLNQNADSIVRATSAAQGGLVANSTLFANDGNGQAIAIPDAGVFFYETRDDAEAGTNAIDVTESDADARAKFIRVKVATRTANYALTPVVGAFSGTIDAEAVAGIGSALCRTPPLMICNPDEPTNNTNKDFDFNANAHSGEGLLAKGGGGNAWAPGNFGFLNSVPGPGNGTDKMREAFGWDAPVGNCISQSGNVTIDTAPGDRTAVATAFNTRFDIYDGDVSCPTPGRCPASVNSVKDLVHPTGAFSNNNACKLHNKGWQQTSHRYLPPANRALDVSQGDTMPDVMGHPRDVCHSTNPQACSGPFGDAFWDRDAYFKANYGWDHAQWQANTGLVIGAGARPTVPTRYQVYKWEIEHRGELVGGATVLGTKAVGGNTAYSAPVCSQTKGFGTGTVPTDTTADRRRLSVAVVNCYANKVKGSSTGVPVRRWMDVFLVQPSINRDRTSQDEIYVEIIGETTAGSAGETAGTVIRRDVPYLIK